MATPVTSPSTRQRRSGAFASWLSLTTALLLSVSTAPLEASWTLPKLIIVGYQLVDATPVEGGVDYVFRARLLNLGPSIPGAVATLTGASRAVTIPDGVLAFGPVGHLMATWSTDTATIRRHGTWLDVLSTLRWSIQVVQGNRPPVADAGVDRTVRVADRVALDGTGSADPDGDPLTYQWSWEERPVGSVAELSEASSVRPTFTVDVPGRYAIALIVHDGTVWSEPDVVEVTTENTTPAADAGDDRTVARGTLVQLDGSRSSDADGDPLTFAWLLVDRPAASQTALDDPTAVRPTLSIDVAGTYVVQLVVHDGQVASTPDTVVLRTDNSPPLADAGSDQTVALGHLVGLDGSGSTDMDGDALTWVWSLTVRPAGSLAVLQDASTVAPSFVADVPGEYVAQLIVNDGLADSAPDTVTISTSNSAPAANAGPDQTVVVGQVVALDSTGSSDPDGDPLAYHWMLVARPPGSAASIADAGAPVTSFVADQPGDYVVQLVVNDGALDSPPDAAVISTLNSAPVANAGPDQLHVPLATTVTLDGQLSSDADGHLLTYSWSLLSQPQGSLAMLVGSTTATPAFEPDVAGDYVAQLIVNDGFTNSAPDTVRVSVDPAPALVTLEATDASATEAGDTGLFTVNRTGDLAQPLVVNLTVQGTATNGVDYATLPATVTIPAGAAATTLTVVPIDDAHLEGREGVVLRLDPGDGYQVGTPGIATVTITDDDTLVSVVATDPVGSEDGPDTAIYTVMRLGPPDDPLTVFYTVSGTAVAGLDYVTLTGQVTFPAGAQETTITLTPLDDTLLEGPETVVLALEPGAGYTLGVVDRATVTIQDDERPAVTVVVSDGTAGEAGPDSGAFTVSRTGPTTNPMTVMFEVSGTATEGLDYQGVGGSVTIPAGATSAIVAIVPIDDTLVEGAEAVVLSLRPGAEYVVVTPGIAALNIADDDLGAVSIDATDPMASEAGLDPGLFTLRRTGDVAAPLTVFLAASGGASSADHDPVGQLVTFAAGESTLPVPVTPRADNLVEGPEDLTLTILPNLAYVVGTPAAATVTIADDPVVVSVVASNDQAREAGLEPGNFLLTRRGGNLATAVTVAVTIGGTALANRDYVVLSGIGTIPAGQSAATLPVVPLADNLVEPEETVTITIGPGTGTTYLVGNPSGATVTIADDPPIVQAITTDADASEAGLDTGRVTFTRTGGDIASALNVFFTKGGTATNGADYQSLGGALSLVTIPAGASTASVTISPLADNLVEGSETAVLTLSASSGYVIGSADSATVTIADDPPVVTITATDPDAAEAGADPGAFTFTRSGGNLATSLTVSFSRSGSASNVTDFVTIPSSVTIPAGQATMTLAIVPIDDNLVEGTETVVLTLNPSGSVIVGASGTATVSIADNE